MTDAERLDLLNDMIAKGIRSTSFRDQRVDFQDIGELRRERDRLQQLVGQSSSWCRPLVIAGRRP